MALEARFFEFRQGQEGGRILSGTAVRYGTQARLPWGEERIEAGAFAPLGDVVLNWQHDRGQPLARTDGGGLVLDDTPEALTVTADLPDTRAADDVLELVRKRILRGLSIEFLAVSERVQAGVRVISRAKLSGVAVVDRPAYSDSEVEARRALYSVLRRKRFWL